MHSQIFGIFGACILLAAAAWAAPAGDVAPGEVLFSKEVQPDGTRLAVVRGPDIPKAALIFLNSRALDQVGKMYEIRFEVRAPSEGPLLLATLMHAENMSTPLLDQKFRVLGEPLVVAGEIDVAVAAAGRIAVWQIRPFGSDASSRILQLGAPWNENAAPVLADNSTASVRLWRNTSGILNAEVVYMPRRPRYHTLYEQAERTESVLRKVKSWGCDQPRAQR